MGNKQKVTNNEQKVTGNAGNEQKVTSNEQIVTSSEQKVTSNEQQAKRSAFFTHNDTSKAKLLLCISCFSHEQYAMILYSGYFAF